MYLVPSLSPAALRVCVVKSVCARMRTSVCCMCVAAPARVRVSSLLDIRDLEVATIP